LAARVNAPIETFGRGARSFNVYTGTVNLAEFDRVITHGDGAVGIQISQPIGRPRCGAGWPQSAKQQFLPPPSLVGRQSGAGGTLRLITKSSGPVPAYFSNCGAIPTFRQAIARHRPSRIIPDKARWLHQTAAPYILVEFLLVLITHQGKELCIGMGDELR
jgi:hypothetical protein